MLYLHRNHKGAFKHMLYEKEGCLILEKFEKMYEIGIFRYCVNIYYHRIFFQVKIF